MHTVIDIILFTTCLPG